MYQNNSGKYIKRENSDTLSYQQKENEEEEEEEDVEEQRRLCRYELEGEIVTPGDILGSVDEFCNGSNTYILKNKLYASISGFVKITHHRDVIKNKNADNKNDSSNSSNNSKGNIYRNDNNECKINGENKSEYNELKKPIIHVERNGINFRIPQLGDIVLCRIYRICYYGIYCEILAVNDILLKYPLKGVINRSDIEVDEEKEESEEINESFSEHDFLKAKIMFHINNGCYKLTTAESNLGVIISMDRKGEILKPVAWCFMYSRKEKKLVKKKVSYEALTFYKELKKSKLLN